MALPKEVKTKSNASKRTKNRIRENGPLFHLGPARTVQCFGHGVVGVFAHSVTTDWVGWFPMDEIDIETNIFEGVA